MKSNQCSYGTLWFNGTVWIMCETKKKKKHLCIPGGDVLSWGSNSHGQLGLGKEVSQQLKPVLVHALNGVAVTQISAGGSHTLFLTLPGLVYCCGANKSGQLGLNRVDEKGTRISQHFFCNYISHASHFGRIVFKCNKV